ncbi:unnamed protein product [Euphydryas editha]|uniref:Uncharacterized protein n=1 Tax=Euphydryas editha TaxID=104508 RepID=A0AAU9TDF7_EUPED|nr:unnamed protein product [Euphydryas editha]CAH2084668.1 unnamed protein product [Euphydryas editha]
MANHSDIDVSKPNDALLEKDKKNHHYLAKCSVVAPTKKISLASSQSINYRPVPRLFGVKAAQCYDLFVDFKVAYDSVDSDFQVRK